MIRFKKKITFLIFFSDLIRKLFKGDRIKRISARVNFFIANEFSKNKSKKLTIIDFGCGSMEVSKKIQNNIFVKEIIGLDIFSYNYAHKKLKYVKYKNLKEIENFKADIIVVIDVLHHIGVDSAFKVLKKLSKISDTLIVKDHFEYGFFSRQLLRFVDFYANYSYGVTIPKKYFTISKWRETINKSLLREVHIEKGFQQHDGLFNVILNKKYHFFSLLKKKI
jgi:hypothetical protein